MGSRIPSLQKWGIHWDSPLREAHANRRVANTEDDGGTVVWPNLFKLGLGGDDLRCSPKSEATFRILWMGIRLGLDAMATRSGNDPALAAEKTCYIDTFYSVPSASRLIVLFEHAPSEMSFAACTPSIASQTKTSRTPNLKSLPMSSCDCEILKSCFESD